MSVFPAMNVSVIVLCRVPLRLAAASYRLTLLRTVTQIKLSSLVRVEYFGSAMRKVRQEEAQRTEYRQDHCQNIKIQEGF